MPTLTLIFRGESLAFELEKIDRDRLYGYVETETTDDAGQPCNRATLAGDGRKLAGPGDTALGYPPGIPRPSWALPVQINGTTLRARPKKFFSRSLVWTINVKTELPFNGEASACRSA